MQHSPIRPLIHVIRGSAAVALATALVALPGLANANTHCERGQIATLQLAGGGESIIHVASYKSPAYDWQRYGIGGPNRDYFATRFWYTNETRWRDRLAMLRTAYAVQLPVGITSSDNNCIGNMDEFTITVCRPGTRICD